MQFFNDIYCIACVGIQELARGERRRSIFFGADFKGVLGQLWRNHRRLLRRLDEEDRDVVQRGRNRERWDERNIGSWEEARARWEKDEKNIERNENGKPSILVSLDVFVDKTFSRYSGPHPWI